MAGIKSLFTGRRKSGEICGNLKTFSVVYLGNVGTTTVKGKGCADKAVEQIWAHYTNEKKKGTQMKLEVTANTFSLNSSSRPSVDYHLNRVTYVELPDNHPKVVAWIYKHQMKKLMKFELRCHAVLCNHRDLSSDLHKTLTENIRILWHDYMKRKKRESNYRKTQDRINAKPLLLSNGDQQSNSPSPPNSFRSPKSGERRKFLYSAADMNRSSNLSASELTAIEEDDEEEEYEENDQDVPSVSSDQDLDFIFERTSLEEISCAGSVSFEPLPDDDDSSNSSLNNNLNGFTGDHRDNGDDASSNDDSCSDNIDPVKSSS